MYGEGETPWGWDRELLAAIFDRLGVVGLSGDGGYSEVPEHLPRPSAAAPRRGFGSAPSSGPAPRSATIPKGETTGSALAKIAAKGRRSG